MNLLNQNQAIKDSVLAEIIHIHSMQKEPDLLFASDDSGRSDAEHRYTEISSIIERFQK